MRLDDGECSDMFDAEEGFHQGCVLAPFIVPMNNIFTAVLRVADTIFIANQCSHHGQHGGATPMKEGEEGKYDGGKGTGYCSKADVHGKKEEAQTLWGML